MEELPDDWFIENDGQGLVLDPEKVLAEINRLQKIISEMEDREEGDRIERDLMT